MLARLRPRHVSDAGAGRRALAALGLAVVLAVVALPAIAAAQSVPAPASPTTAGPAADLTPPNGGEATAATSSDAATPSADLDGEYSAALKIILAFAALSLVPAAVLAMTSFTRIIIVLSMMRQAVGIVQLPPSRVLVGLSLFLTLFTMSPVLERVNAEALEPYKAGELGEWEALDKAMDPMRTFMLRHTREADLALFIGLAGGSKPDNAEDVSTLALVPAFMLSELKTAFQMGALLFLPFLAIDLLVASVLMSMGMMMLPPMTISLPLKVLVFVAVDGWTLVIDSLARGFAV